MASAKLINLVTLTQLLPVIVAFSLLPTSLRDLRRKQESRYAVALSAIISAVAPRLVPLNVPLVFVSVHNRHQM
jgi:hypothetical protein